MHKHPVLRLALAILLLSCAPGDTPTQRAQNVQSSSGAAALPDAAFVVGVAPGGVTQSIPAVTPAGSGPAPEVTLSVERGVTYRIQVSGTFNGGASYPKPPDCPDYIADAHYHICSTQNTANPWLEAADPNDFRGPEHFDLQLWNAQTAAFETPRWNEPYNEGHVYTMLWTADDDTLRLKINDPDAGDNDGALQVALDPVTCGNRGETCCQGRSCALDLICDPSDPTANAQCIPCGGAGQPACQDSCRARTVSATGPAGAPPAELVVPVRAGQAYLLSASGTYDAGNGVSADVKYSRQGSGPWSDMATLGGTTLRELLDLQIWDDNQRAFISPDWGGFTFDHRYGLLWTARSDMLRLRLNDPDAGDNVGTLALQICPATCGTVGQSCCFGSVCVAGTGCDAAGQCTACGQPGQPSCPGPCTAFTVNASLAATDTASCPPALQIAGLTPGATYRVAASGTYRAIDDTRGILTADARYSSFDNRVTAFPWSDVEAQAGNSDKGAPFLDLQLRNGSGPGTFTTPAWPSFNPEHRYSALWQATGNTLCLRTNDDSPDDNAGGLRVEVCETACGAVGQGCCAGGGCDAGSTCDTSDHCVACGGVDEPMCCGQRELSAASAAAVDLSVTPGVRYQLTATGSYVASDNGNYQVLADAVCVYDGQQNPDQRCWQGARGNDSGELFDLQLWDPGTQRFTPFATADNTCLLPSAAIGCDDTTHRYTLSWMAPSDGTLRLRINNPSPAQSTGSLRIEYCIEDPAACDDGTPCTVDRVENGRCVHTNAPQGTLCRAAADSCDVAETCTGSSPTCPANTFKPASTVCRPASDICDTAELCTGSSPSCPADETASQGTLCRASTGLCDTPEVCSGTSKQCPADQISPSGTVCRQATELCDVAEQCNGTSALCPNDGIAQSGVVCRQASGLCDVAEQCDGQTKSCPSDAVAPSTVVCRQAVDLCDVAEQCTGQSKACPSDGYASAATVCRSAVGRCDEPELCTGTSPACPSDRLTASGVLCNGALLGPCDAPDYCNGTQGICPMLVAPSTTVCRLGAPGACQSDARCDGSQITCPANPPAAQGSACADDGNACTADLCNASGQCQHSVVAGATCNDGNACTRGDTCTSAGVCSGSALSCDDGNACTADSCDAALGCRNTPITGGGSTTCGIGACLRTVQNCVNGVPQTCTPGTPTAETCNGIDDNCNGSVDDGALSTFYRDADGDGYGNPGVSTQACSAPAGYVSNAADCNDGNAAIRPGAAEICNGVDDNCNGSVDEGVRSTFYRDADGDGYGNPSVSTLACSRPAGYVANASDCNDGNAAIRPGAAETCNGVDDDCDGSVDEGACSCTPRTCGRGYDGDECGYIYDGCGGTINCSCRAGSRCNNGFCTLLCGNVYCFSSLKSTSQPLE